ncbi:hypothetical protein PoB_006086900 [Plakobranchus ocellatus]|uniref:Uncharacterized protein n=1 Tax=Plakobranchus ocellatus TaxID=259542 RepID=A0AAV4CR78_9GAST|nr:hypothetical protein PoB_006086900 [Plakobranchus ocellatus]
MTQGVNGTVDNETALRSAGTILSWVQAPASAPWPDGGPESLRSPCCGLAMNIHKPKYLANLPFQQRLDSDLAYHVATYTDLIERKACMSFPLDGKAVCPIDSLTMKWVGNVGRDDVTSSWQQLVKLALPKDDYTH